MPDVETITNDDAGNILTANGHTYTYGDSTWTDLLTAFDNGTISYDNSGNPTSYYNGTRWTMSWENGRSLTSMLSPMRDKHTLALKSNDFRASSNFLNYRKRQF